MFFSQTKLFTVGVKEVHNKVNNLENTTSCVFDT